MAGFAVICGVFEVDVDSRSVMTVAKTMQAAFDFMSGPDPSDDNMNNEYAGNNDSEAEDLTTAESSPVTALKEQLEKVTVRRSDLHVAERIIHQHPIANWTEHLEFEHDSGIGNLIVDIC